MLANPRVGVDVMLRYGRPNPLHGKLGRVVVAGRGKPRNHLVRVGGKLYVVPCGQMFCFNAPG